MNECARQVAQRFWALMQTNDFPAVATVLAPDFVLEWPQTKERIRGAERFVRMNVEYPAHGRWQFTIHRIVGNAREAVSDVGVTDGVLQARAITFFEIADERIRRITEYWPEPCAAPAGRAHLVERMD
jgi:ketosteroid isomerase-like protein